MCQTNFSTPDLIVETDYGFGLRSLSIIQNIDRKRGRTPGLAEELLAINTGCTCCKNAKTDFSTKTQGQILKMPSEKEQD